jgi:hypothetical protein
LIFDAALLEFREAYPTSHGVDGPASNTIAQLSPATSAIYGQLGRILEEGLLLEDEFPALLRDLVSYLRLPDKEQRRN